MTSAPQPLQDPAQLLALGRTPDEVRANLNAALDGLEAHLRERQADWTTTQPGREWSPAQEAEHVLLINDSIAGVMGLLLSDKPLREMPKTPGVLKDGKRQAPSFAQPSAAGLTSADLDTRWAQSRAKLEAVAEQVRETPDRTFWHPFFGDLDALNWLRMVAGHAASHHALLKKSAPQHG